MPLFSSQKVFFPFDHLHDFPWTSTGSLPRLPVATFQQSLFASYVFFTEEGSFYSCTMPPFSNRPPNFLPPRHQAPLPSTPRSLRAFLYFFSFPPRTFFRPNILPNKTAKIPLAAGPALSPDNRPPSNEFRNLFLSHLHRLLCSSFFHPRLYVRSLSGLDLTRILLRSYRPPLPGLQDVPAVFSA